ncbi:hypothetical protein ACFE04_000923 [Oxalis oulophora]
MEKNTLFCASFKYEELRAVKILKKGRSGQVVLYGESLEQLVERYNISQDYRMDFQNMGGNQFMVRIRDKQGVEIEYEKRMIDNSRWYQSKKKATTPSLFKLFGEEEASDGYLALPGNWGKHFEDLTMQEVFLLVPDGSRWAIETRYFNDGTIRMFGAEFRKLVMQYGIRNNWHAIFDYGENMTFYLRIADEDGVEIEYAGSHKGEGKKYISTPDSPEDTDTTEIFIENSDTDSDSDEYDLEESGGTKMIIYYPVIGDTSTVEPGKIWYFNGFLYGEKYGDKGEPGFTKKLTTAVYRSMLPIYLPRSFVRKHLLPIGKPTVAFMTFGDGEKVECNIRWGSVTSLDNAFISGGLPSFMNLLKPDVGDTVLFNLTEWNELESSVTFQIDTMDE